MRGPLVVGAVIIAAALGGAIVGRVSASPSGAVASREATTPAGSPALATPNTATHGPATVVLDEAQVDNAIQKAVRAELRKAEADREARREPPQEPAPPTDAQRTAAQDGRTVVHGATAARRWSAKDAAELRRLLPSMQAKDAHEVIDGLIVAINTDQVKVELEGPLF